MRAPKGVAREKISIGAFNGWIAIDIKDITLSICMHEGRHTTLEDLTQSCNPRTIRRWPCARAFVAEAQETEAKVEQRLAPLRQRVEELLTKCARLEEELAFVKQDTEFIRAVCESAELDFTICLEEDMEESRVKQ